MRGPGITVRRHPDRLKPAGSPTSKMGKTVRMHDAQDIDREAKEHSDLIEVGVDDVEKKADQEREGKDHDSADKGAVDTEKALGSNTAE